MQTLQGSFLALVNGGPLGITKSFFCEPPVAKEQALAESKISLVFDAEQDYYRVEFPEADAR